MTRVGWGKLGSVYSHYHALRWQGVSKDMDGRIEKLRREPGCINSAQGDQWRTLTGPVLEYTPAPFPFALRSVSARGRDDHGRFLAEAS